MSKPRAKIEVKPGQIWTVLGGFCGFYIIEKLDKTSWLGIYIERLSDKKYIEGDYTKRSPGIKSKDKKIRIRHKSLLEIFKLELDAELVDLGLK